MDITGDTLFEATLFMIKTALIYLTLFFMILLILIELYHNSWFGKYLKLEKVRWLSGFINHYNFYKSIDHSYDTIKRHYTKKTTKKHNGKLIVETEVAMEFEDLNYFNSDRYCSYQRRLDNLIDESELYKEYKFLEKLDDELRTEVSLSKTIRRKFSNALVLQIELIKSLQQRIEPGIDLKKEEFEDKMTDSLYKFLKALVTDGVFKKTKKGYRAIVDPKPAHAAALIGFIHITPELDFSFSLQKEKYMELAAEYFGYSSESKTANGYFKPINNFYSSSKPIPLKYLSRFRKALRESME